MVGGSGGLTEYLVQQSQEFHRRVDKLDEQAKRMNEQEITIEENLKSHQEKEKKFLDGITDKYGQGTISLDSGEFLPDK